MSALSCVVIWLFAVMGFYELLFVAVSFLFLAPTEKNCGIIELHGHMENAEHIIRSALLHSSGRVYIIDCGADNQTRLIAEILSYDCRRVVLLRSDESVLTAFGENTVQ